MPLDEFCEVVEIVPNARETERTSVCVYNFDNTLIRYKKSQGNQLQWLVSWNRNFICLGHYLNDRDEDEEFLIRCNCNATTKVWLTLGSVTLNVLLITWLRSVNCSKRQRDEKDKRTASGFVHGTVTSTRRSWENWARCVGLNVASASEMKRAAARVIINAHELRFASRIMASWNRNRRLLANHSTTMKKNALKVNRRTSQGHFVSLA